VSIATAGEPASVGFAVRNLSKIFSGTVALDRVDLDVRSGEIHGLIGGNGSGKSTLIKIAAGVYRGEPGGAVQIGETRTDTEHMSPVVAHAAGLRVVHQDLGIFPEMTIAENLCLGTGFVTNRAGRIRSRETASHACELMERFEIPGHPGALLRELSRAAQTEVAIARALQHLHSDSPGVLILDEPTTALPAHEVMTLLKALRRHASNGHSILYVSHRLRELLFITDRMTVLRDGCVSGVLDTTDVVEPDLIRAITGAEVAGAASRSPGARRVDTALRVRELHVWPLRGVSFDLLRGEIVGLAGLLGSGRTKLLRALFGDVRVESGVIELDGRSVRFDHPADAIAAGVGFVPEDRAADAAFLDEPVFVNIAAGRWRRYWRKFRMRARAMRTDAAEAMGRFQVRAPSERALLNTLSGGNQQKAVLARWIGRSPGLLLLDEPTQGVDIGARAEIHKLVRGAADDGTSVIIVASDLEELALLCDRVLVIGNGRVRAEASGDVLTADELTRLVHAQERE
jgi:ribose transport system ATP-binding protein